MNTWHHVLRKQHPRINEIKHLRGRNPFYCLSRVTVDHRLALSKPALPSAPSKKLISALRAPCGERNGSVLDCARQGAAVTILVACNPVKKHGPWVVARLRVVTPSGDPV